MPDPAPAKFEDVVVALDSSISMRAKDFEPSRFEAARAALKRFLEVRLTTCPMDRVGLVVFYAFALPVFEPSTNLKSSISSVGQLKVLGEATNLGDAILKAAGMHSSASSNIESLSRKILVITDGTFNEGPDPWTASIYARSKNIRIDFLTIGKLDESDRSAIGKVTELTGGEESVAENSEELFSKIVDAADRRATQLARP